MLEHVLQPEPTADALTTGSPPESSATLKPLHELNKALSRLCKGSVKALCWTRIKLYVHHLNLYSIT
jgi:hypothetical protein